MMANRHVLDALLASHVIPEIQQEILLAQQECTHLKVNLLANLALQALCALAQWDLEYLSALMELSHKWDQLSVLTALRAFSVHLKIKQ
jgi:hypothetical protein